MNVAIIQTNIAWHEPKNNIQHIDKLIDANKGADLYILPEMFTTGFSMNPESIADTDGASLTWMKERARQISAAVAGTVIVEKNGAFYNRMYFVKPNGETTVYDKRHLFSFSGEDKHYTPGKKRVVVEWKGVRIFLQTCYDLRFPVFSRNKGDYDMIVYVASWPDRRHDVWTTLLKARALENQCYVAGVNRTGDDPQCHYIGGSAVISPYGRYLAMCEDNTEEVAIATIDIQKLQEFRKKFPVLQDADDFTIYLDKE